MNEPSPIRGRWTLEPYADDPQRVRHLMARNPDDLYGEAVEVVPVPDEQAIERAAKALARRYGEEVGFADWLGIARTVASALEPPE